MDWHCPGAGWQFRPVGEQMLAGIGFGRLELRAPIGQTHGSAGRDRGGGDYSGSVRDRAVSVQIETMIIRRYDGFAVGRLHQKGSEALIAENNSDRGSSARMAVERSRPSLMENRPHQGQSGHSRREPVQAESQR